MLYTNGKDSVFNSFRVAKCNYENSDMTLDEIDISKVNLNSGKNIVILCGNNTKSPMRAGSYAYYCFQWLKDNKISNDITAYSIFYPRSQPLMPSFEPDPYFDYDALAEILFAQNIEFDDKKISTKQLKKCLENTIFFGHSAGGFIMNKLMHGLQKILTSHGTSSKQIEAVFNSIVFVGYSAYDLVDAPINAIYISPIYDSIGSTKRSYDKMLESKDVVSSNPTLTLERISNIQADSYASFLNLLETAMRGTDTAYYMHQKTMHAIPNLLYDDGFIKEDHNLAGVLNYPTENPRKTKAGKLTTNFLRQVFEYTLSVERSKFSTSELFDLASQENQNTTEHNKEL